MRFGKALHRLLDFVLFADPALGPTYLCKVDTADVYICIRVRAEYVPSIAFIIPKETADEEQLASFHLSIPMGYMEPSSFFCRATETVKDRSMETLDRKSQVPPSHDRNLTGVQTRRQFH